MSRLEFDRVSFTWNKSSPEAVEVFNDLSFTVDNAEFVSILGPSGCGKSTVMQLAAGLEFPDAGAVCWNGQPVEGPGPERGLLFQKAVLFPWCTALSATDWGLRMKGTPSAERKQIARRMLADVGLSAFAHTRVRELSGGMRQRVAIAQILANDCQLILMDEPYAGLDLQTRVLMQNYLQALRERTCKSILMVTHDVDEALMADRVIVLRRRPTKVLLNRALGELGRPRNLYSPDYIRLRGKLIHHIQKEVDAIAQETGDWESARNTPPVCVAENHENQIHSMSPNTDGQAKQATRGTAGGRVHD